MQELIFLTTLLWLLAEGAPSSSQYSEGSPPEPGTPSESILVLVDIGTNYTLPCGDSSQGTGSVMWDRVGIAHTRVQEDGSLFFPNLQESDSGLYSCQAESDEDSSGAYAPPAKRNNSTGSAAGRKPALPLDPPNPKTWFRVKVRTPPHELRNVTVLPSTILASIMWENGDDGGYPILSFHVRYRLKNATDEEWMNCKPDQISPLKRHLDIFHLAPNATYLFEMWASNQLGKGASTLVEESTHNDMQEIQVGKYLLEGVDTFDTRAWIVAVGVVLGTLTLLALATCCLFYKEYSLSGLSTAVDSSRRRFAGTRASEPGGEDIELIPNIIFNPVFDMQAMEVVVPDPDENSNDSGTRRHNNNSVIFPTRV